MSDARTSASPAELTAAELRQLDRRAEALAAAADRAEDGVVDALVDELRRLQATARDLLAAGEASFAVVSGRMRPALVEARSALTRIFAGGLDEAARLGVDLVEETLALIPTASPLPQVTVVTVLDQAGVARSVIYVDDTLGQIRRHLDLETLRLVTGETNLAGALEAVGTEPAGSRVFGRAAERLQGAARAELGRAHSEHVQRSLEGATESEPRLGKRWVSAHGPNARPRHAAVESQGVVPVGERFTVGRFQALGPRMPGLPGAERIHCRCRVVPALTKETANGD